MNMKVHMIFHEKVQFNVKKTLSLYFKYTKI